ncbi:MAG: 30S ribosomal protein S8 [Candidatus Portnoybacteria bacterium]
MVDSISDMLTRIRNAQAVGHKTVIFPFSKVKLEIAKTLEKEGFIGKIEIKGKKVRKEIEVVLKYEKNRPIITTIKRISKPGRRMYIKKDQIRPIRQGYGISIISTPSGVMSNKEAKKKGLGGEIICQVW